jgi:hypothetical protein
MARDFIALNPNAAGATQAPLLRSYIQSLRSAYNLGVQCAAIMTHNNDGTDFTDIETIFGAEAGSGQVLFDLVNGSTGAMNGQFQNNDCKTITEKVG